MGGGQSQQTQTKQESQWSWTEKTTNRDRIGPIAYLGDLGQLN